MAKSKKHKNRNWRVLVKNSTLIDNPYTDDFLKSLIEKFELDVDFDQMKFRFDNAWLSYKIKKLYKGFNKSDTIKIYKDIFETTSFLSELLGSIAINEEEPIVNSGFDSRKEYESFKKYNIELSKRVKSELDKFDTYKHKGGRPQNFAEISLVLSLLRYLENSGLKKRRIERKFIHECLLPLPDYTWKEDKEDLEIGFSQEHRNETLNSYLNKAKALKKQRDSFQKSFRKIEYKS